MTKSTSDSGDSTADKPYRLNPFWRLYDNS